MSWTTEALWFYSRQGQEIYPCLRIIKSMADAHQGAYSLTAGWGLFVIGKTGGLTTHLHLLTRLSMCGTMPPLLHMLLWHVAWLSRGKIYFHIESYHHYTTVSTHLLLDHVYICLFMGLGSGAKWFAVSIPWKFAEQKTVFLCACRQNQVECD